MLGYILSAVVILLLFSYFIAWPVVEYFRDPKGLRKYPNLNLLSGITDLAFCYEAHKGFRSHALLVAHQKSPVVRIGPNSLSYSDLAAIKVGLSTASKHWDHAKNDQRTFMGTTQSVSKTSSMIPWLVLITISPMYEISWSTSANVASCPVPMLSKILKAGNTKSLIRQHASLWPQMPALPSL